MNMRIALVALAATVSAGAAFAEGQEKDIIRTSKGDLEITFVGHGSLVFAFGGKVIHVDPFSKVGDYTKLPKADAVLVTHAHGDHLDPAALSAIRTPATEVVVSPSCAGKVDGAVVMKNGEEKVVAGVPVLAVPAYNLVAMRSPGVPYH